MEIPIFKLSPKIDTFLVSVFCFELKNWKLSCLSAKQKINEFGTTKLQFFPKISFKFFKKFHCNLCAVKIFIQKIKISKKKKSDCGIFFIEKIQIPIQKKKLLAFQFFWVVTKMSSSYYNTDINYAHVDGGGFHLLIFTNLQESKFGEPESWDTVLRNK